MTDPVVGLQPARNMPRSDGDPARGVRIHFDGACQRVRGRSVAAYGFVVSGAGPPYEECGLAVPPGSSRSTNNVAEYVAATRALEYLQRSGYRGPVELIGDSELVVRQMRGEYEVRSDRLRRYHATLQELAAGFATIEFVWTPRERNVEADALSKRPIAAFSNGLPVR